MSKLKDHFTSSEFLKLELLRKSMLESKNPLSVFYYNYRITKIIDGVKLRIKMTG